MDEPGLLNYSLVSHLFPLLHRADREVLGCYTADALPLSYQQLQGATEMSSLQ